MGSVEEIDVRTILVRITACRAGDTRLSSAELA